MQYKVPQNIDLADKIVGPLTLIQFLYLMVGGIIDYALFSIVAPVNQLVFFVAAIPVTLIALAFTFLKVQDQPFSHFFVSFLQFLIRPKRRVWSKDGSITNINIVPDHAPEKPIVAHKMLKRDQLEQVAGVLERGTNLPTTNQPLANQNK